MYIFVYGSLKQGKRLNYLLKNSKFIATGKTLNKYPLIVSKHKWYPYLLNKKNRGYFISGEVYKIDFKTLKRLDRVEEAPYYYFRKKIAIKIGYKTIQAWVYFKRKNIKFFKKELLLTFD